MSQKRRPEKRLRIKSPMQKKYCATQKELLAVVYYVCPFHFYLIGQKILFYEMITRAQPL